jgi:hypothetical protein
MRSANLASLGQVVQIPPNCYLAGPEAITQVRDSNFPAVLQSLQDELLTLFFQYPVQAATILNEFVPAVGASVPALDKRLYWFYYITNNQKVNEENRVRSLFGQIWSSILFDHYAFLSQFELNSPKGEKHDGAFATGQGVLAGTGLPDRRGSAFGG